MRAGIRFCIFLSVFVLLAGCADKPVRHLASDASLIVVGTSTKEDVLTFLGDPDEQQIHSGDMEIWEYLEEHASTLQRTPYIGKLFGPQRQSRIVVTFMGNKVSDCTYSSSSSDEYDWADDYSWQEKRP
ncbi:MAG: hypothetical protein CR981_01490 [Proteobacteria bacterium]|nr:MAG: hypothetical protein CR981_01490 [Pseudomonadota bacterium]PIE64250.1 MAG: hypothetical protein CSA26_09240 [Desulfobacterales bacterium]